MPTHASTVWRTSAVAFAVSGLTFFCSIKFARHLLSDLTYLLLISCFFGCKPICIFLPEKRIQFLLIKQNKTGFLHSRNLLESSHTIPSPILHHPINGELFSMLKNDGMRPIVRHQPTFAIRMAIGVTMLVIRKVPRLRFYGQRLLQNPIVRSILFRGLWRLAQLLIFRR